MLTFKLIEVLQDGKGSLSSKRFFAIGCFINAIILSYTIKDPVLVGMFLAPAITVLISQAVTKT
jgi:hypothetical protein